jgi:hypothetical protein
MGVKANKGKLTDTTHKMFKDYIVTLEKLRDENPGNNDKMDKAIKYYKDIVEDYTPKTKAKPKTK